MRERLLVRHFLTRFLEHDLVSSNADRREILSVAGGTLMAVSLFVSALIALQYQFANFLPPGITAARSLDERFLFVSASMLIMALLAVALWDGLTLDARDAAVLGLLPVPRSTIVRAKFSAVALVAVGTDIGWNLAPTLFRAASLPLTIAIGFKGALTLTVTQGVVTLAAGAFGFLAVLALREGLAVLLGQDRFRSISSTLQAALIVALTSALLLLPGSYSRVARGWWAGSGITRKVLPPFWFVGLHETLAGAVIDRLPRTKPQAFLVRAERDDTAFYRSLWPVFHESAPVAVVALVVVAILAIAACAWNNRRLPVPAARRRDSVRRRQLWRSIVGRTVASSPVQQAGFWFTLQALPRRATHRAVLASAVAVGLSLMVVTVRDQILEVHTEIAAVPLSILAAQSLLLAALVTGLRHAVQLPADLRAGTTFSLAWKGELRPYVSGVKRAGWIVLILPALVVLFIWHSVVLGVPTAVLHAGTGVVTSMLLMELLFLRYRRLPLVSGYVPSADLKSRGPAYVGAVFLASYTTAWIERSAMTAAPAYVLVFNATLLAVGVGVAVFDRAQDPVPGVLELDEEVPLPTQRLNLAG